MSGQGVEKDVKPPGLCACGHASGDHRSDGCRLCFGYCGTRVTPPGNGADS